MQYKSILINWKLRFIIGLISAIVFKFSVDILFGIIYTKYSIFKPIRTYVWIIVLTIIIVQIFYFIGNYLDQKISWNEAPKKRFFVQLSIHLTIVLLAFGPVRWTINYVFADNYFAVLKNETIILITSAMVALIFNSIDLGLYLLFKWRSSLAEIERFKKENAEFQFEMLRNQVNPHFLFNSLNTLSSLMYENLDLASDYIRKLSQVYRYVLENRQNELVSLKKEIDFISSYKYLFELRFKDRLKINIDIKSEDFEKQLVPMTIQMLVENAVKHNVIGQKYPLSIDIYTNNNTLFVKNNLRKKSPEGYSSGMGLVNIQSRYSFVSDEKIQIQETIENFIVTVPLIKRKSE